MSDLPALTIEQYEQLNPVLTIEFGDRKAMFCTPNAFSMWRAQTIAEKEPVTFEWVQSFGRDEVLVDVGANVGMYTILAAILSDARVFAFEPESQNFAVLNKNIVINGLGERVRAWPAALSDEPGFSELHLSDFSPAGSGHAFGEPLDFRLEPARFPYVQGAVATTLDRLVADGVVPAPNHLKIDVDGLEHKVVRGATRALDDPALKSVLVEVNPALAEHRALVADIESRGFRYDPDQVAAATRTEGAFAGLAEHLFRRG